LVSSSRVEAINSFGYAIGNAGYSGTSTIDCLAIWNATVIGMTSGLVLAIGTCGSN
jgi:hypothetical protein